MVTVRPPGSRLNRRIVQGTFSEHFVEIQGTLIEHSLNIQERLWNIW
jgi:hypothetical protein